MFIALIVSLLFLGLIFFGMAIHRLWLLDWMQANAPVPSEASGDDSSDDEPKMTKLGRPITEIRMSA